MRDSSADTRDHARDNRMAVKRKSSTRKGTPLSSDNPRGRRRSRQHSRAHRRHRRTIHALINDRARFAQWWLSNRRAARRWISTARNAKRRCCAGLLSAIRAVARRGNSAAVSRDHVGLPGPTGAAQGGVPRARGHVHAGRGAEAFRVLRALAPLPAIDEVFHEWRRRGDFGVVPIGTRARARQSHARHVPLLLAQDLR